MSQAGFSNSSDIKINGQSVFFGGLTTGKKVDAKSLFGGFGALKVNRASDSIVISGENANRASNAKRRYLFGDDFRPARVNEDNFKKELAEMTVYIAQQEKAEMMKAVENKLDRNHLRQFASDYYAYNDTTEALDRNEVKTSKSFEC